MPNTTSASLLPPDHYAPTHEEQEAARAEHLAHVRLAESCFPGPRYQAWLNWFHRHSRPRTYIEIGVESGQTMQYVRPGTQAIGIDPAPRLTHTLPAGVRIEAQTSDAFFASQHKSSNVNSIGPVDLAFIDGLHTFDQALRDFMHLEALCEPSSVILLHDTFPLTAITAQRQRASQFWVGDTWKVVMILRQARPDLHIFTIPTFPSGLTVVTRLNPGSRVLHERYPQLIELCMPLEFADFSACLEDILGTIPANSEDAVLAALATFQTQTSLAA